MSSNVAAPSVARRFASSSANPQRRIWFALFASCLWSGVAVAWGTPALWKACDLGDAVQCNDLGVISLHGHGVPADPSVALRAFERSCAYGSPDGCSNLGALYENGVGVATNLMEAARLYERACANGGALGCSNLGALYARGRGVARDLAEARRLFTLACQNDSAAGCNNLLRFSLLRH